jgi:TolB-like protein/Tfp pilus assembly protein PilF
VNPTKFLTELKRRNVYRAAVAYGVVAWFLTQLTTQVFPFFEIPNSAVRFVVIALAVGFPIAMLLSWLYEFTPEGIVRTEDLHPAQARSIQRAAGRILDFIIIGVLLLVIAMLIVGRLPSYRQTGESISQKSIAVLPFENLSEDKANAYFAEGIQEEILTRLAKIADLKVISRTSTQRYQSKPGNLSEIAKQLGVANILEGSVQKAGDTVRVSVNLIQAASDSHLWANTYDRKLTDILGVESEIAKTIAEQLQAKLSGREEQALAVKPTNNPEAYDAYLLARFELNKFTERDFIDSIHYFQQAIALDPRFALAHAGLAEAYNTIGYWGFLPPKEAFPEAKKAVQQALELDPALAEAHTALAFVQFEYDWRFEEADAEFKEAIRLKPGSASAHLWFAEFLMQMERFQESEKELEHARELDPLSVRIRFDFAAMFFYKRQFDGALDELQKAIAMDPNNGLVYGLLDAVFYQKKMPDQSFNASEKANSLGGFFSSEEMAEMRKVYESAGLSAYCEKTNEFLRKQLATGKYRSPLTIALNYAKAGSDSEALDWLEKAVEERTPWLPELKADPTWDGLRSQPRFEALVQKVFAPRNTEAESAEQVPGTSESLAKSIAVLPFEHVLRRRF